MFKFIKPFSQIDLNNLQEAGGKGANLGEMVQAGLPIPPGYCITSEAYRYFVSQSGIDNLLIQLANKDLIKMDDIAAISQEITKCMLETPVPEELEKEIIRAYTEIIGDGMLVAVRSSATAEDLPEASFAGQQESYLNVSVHELMNRVKQCWASLWTERAIHYRINTGYDHQSVLLAVVVQQMVDSEVSGVAFSVNPINSNQDEMIIEAVWGLGEGIVSGQVTPDHYIINKKNDAIIGYEISDKEKMVVRSQNGLGTVFVSVADSQRLKSTLTSKEILELARLVKKIEGHYGSPQDIEWALAVNRFYILQSRPITTIIKSLNEVNIQETETEFFNFDPELEWTNLGGIRERYNEPLSVLGWSIIEPCQTEGGLFVYRAFTKKELPSEIFVANIYGYLYLNFSSLKGLQPLKMLETYFNDENREQFMPKRTRFEELLLLARSYKGGNELIKSLDKEFYNTLPNYLNELDRLKAIDVKTLDTFELLNFIKDNLSLAKSYFRYQTSSMTVAEGLYNMLISLMKKWLGDEDLSLSSKLVSGLPHNLTVQTNNEIWKLTEAIEASPNLRKELEETNIPNFLSRLASSPEGRLFKTKLTDFLSKYGHLNVNMDIAQDFWWEKPEIVLSMVKGSLTANKRTNPVEREKQKQKEREETELFVRHNLNILQRLIFNKTLKVTQAYMLLRDNRHFYVTMPFSLIKKGVRTLAESLLTQKYLVNEEDIYYLTLDEVEGLLHGKMTWDKGHQKINQRKAAPKVSLDELPSLFKGWPTSNKGNHNNLTKPAELLNDRKGVLLKGVAGSPGLVHGRVKIVYSPLDFSQFQSGDILVAVNTDPAWTPLFSIASGVVTDYGGLLSHGAIVAREYGIPAVLGVKNATKILKDGQKITVDGNKGVVSEFNDE